MIKVTNYNGMFISILTVLLPLIFQLAYIKYISYNVNQNIYGDFILLSSFVILLTQVFLSLLMQAFGRFYHASKKIDFINEFRTYLIIVNVLSLLVFYIFYLFYGVRFEIKIYLFIYLLFILSNSYALNQQLFLLNLERKKYFILKIFEGSAKFIVPIIGYYYFPTLNGLVAGIVVGYLISFSLIASFLKEYPFKITFNLVNHKKYFKYAYPMIFTALSSWSISFSDRYFIDYFLDTKEVAVYSLLSQLAGFAQIAGMIYATYVVPKVLSMYNSDQMQAYRLLRKYLKDFVLSLIVLFIIFLLLPKELFVIFVKKDIIADSYYSSVLTILVLSVFLTILQTAVSLYFVLFKKLFIYAVFFIIAAFINIIINFSISEYGIIAAAYSTVISYGVLNILIFWWVKIYARKIMIRQRRES